MKFVVDLNTCENYGQCTFASPDLFTLADDGELSFRKQADAEYVSPELAPDQIDEAERALSVCPMQAISAID